MKIKRNSLHLRATFFHGYGCALILTKSGLGYILGVFFKNSSGHPACGLVECTTPSKDFKDQNILIPSEIMMPVRQSSALKST
jgi:hypothetical protein